jgi:hypothetical protein
MKLVEKNWMSSAFCFFVTISVACLSAASQESSEHFRTWEDESGAYQIDAIFTEYMSGKVKLLRRDGQAVTVDYRRLSPDDREYVRSLVTRERAKNPRHELSEGNVSKGGAPRSEEDPRGEVNSRLKPEEKFEIDWYGSPQAVVASNSDRPLIWFRILGDIDGFM